MVDDLKQLDVRPAAHGPGDTYIYIYALGRFCLSSGDITISDDSSRFLKIWSVVCYFILHRDRAIPVSELVDQFYHDEEQADPQSTLRMLILRIRRLLSPLFRDDIVPIVNRRNAYQWNPDIFCYVDAEIFDSLCSHAAAPMTPKSDRMELYRKALLLYKGDLLPKQGDQRWVIPLSARYRDRLSSAAHEYATMLGDAGLYSEMNRVALAACGRLPLDEPLHILAIRSYLLQKKHTEALRFYEHTTGHFYQSLGIRPTAELQSVYREIMDEENSFEDDLDSILASMSAPSPQDGAFFCEYGLFSSIYALERRRIGRSGGCIHLALLSLIPPRRHQTNMATINSVMDELRLVILKSLRLGDVVSRYSGRQFLIMLPSASLEDSGMVVDRIVSSFFSRFPASSFKITYTLRGIEPSV